MNGVLGGGVIFVVAALLWAAVLVPAWMRRREFRAAEQNAVRLQRTLRVLAETAEVPTEVRLEATAREALAHEKLLRTAQRQQEAERQEKLALARAAQVRAEMKAQQMKRKQAAIARAARLRRPVVRRTRAIAALVAILSLAGMLVGAGFVFAGQGWVVLSVAGLCFAAALGGLVLLAPGRVKLAAIPAEQLPEPIAKTGVAQSDAASSDAVDEQSAAEAATAAATAAHLAAQAAAAARLDRARAHTRARATLTAAELKNQPHSMLLQVAREQAAADATAAGRDVSTPAESAGDTEAAARAHAAEVTQARELALAQARAERERAIARTNAEAAERLRRMGVVDDTSDGALDLDQVLRQRRRAG